VIRFEMFISSYTVVTLDPAQLCMIDL
jgi:hypothetical protein